MTRVFDLEVESEEFHFAFVKFQLCLRAGVWNSEEVFRVGEMNLGDVDIQMLNGWEWM